jgi:hypothetical protein
VELLLRVNTQADTTTIRLFKDQSSPAPFKDFVCTVSSGGRDYRSEIPATELQAFLAFVGSANISVSGACPMGLDGASYELTVEEGTAHATYRWWMTPDERWRPLQEIASRLLNMGARISGKYLP